MQWNEVTRIDVAGSRIAAKDGMVMLGSDEPDSAYPLATVEPGTFVAEIYLPEPWFCTRFRLRRVDSNPERRPALGTFDVDSGKATFVDYDTFQAVVSSDPDAYEDWTAGELDDELALNFSGKIEFRGTDLVYVKSANGDGRYRTYALLETGMTVGMECEFEA